MDKRFYLNISRGAAASLLWLASQAAFAASAVEEAQTLLSQGQFDQALKKVEGQLKTAPQDAEARFLRGLILVKLNRGPEAIKVFADLTRDYPQLPEPYNNLAVLYAQQGDYEKARDALEAALATHPSYATAHENLGDLYARLATQAYGKALQLDSSNTSAQSKLALIKDLASASPAGRPAAWIQPPTHRERSAGRSWATVIAMNLAGDYASACHHVIHEKIAKQIGRSPLKMVENHHNFAWREEHSGEALVVIRKGATPAFPGQKGFIGGSMGDDAVIVRGIDSPSSAAA